MLRWGALLMTIPLCLLVGLYTLEVQDVVQCEASGGVYDFVNGICDPTGNAPFVSFAARHPWLVNGAMVVALLGTFLTVWGMLIKGMAHPKDRD